MTWRCPLCHLPAPEVLGATLKQDREGRLAFYCLDCWDKQGWGMNHTIHIKRQAQGVEASRMSL